MRMLLLCVFAARLLAQDPTIEMAQIPAGEFTMGRTRLTPDDKTTMRPRVLLDDRPDHKVHIGAFQLDRTEVTHAHYEKFVKATNRRPPYHWLNGVMPPEAAQWPVYNVDWDDANAYCVWAGKRLPTEAEWERAARGGREGLNYPWGDKADPKLALYNTPNGAQKVAQFPPNDFGLFDMAGSVSEWTADWFDREYYLRSPAANPKGPENGSYRVIRGGAWSDGPARITVFFRNWVRPNHRTPNLGFRCAK
ncbi:MAG: formylglycine-generating enzyme family protein [Bryobacterales bacterium]|nr:formylglycine-generating enzyme family protein [Bryobacterales bacterium]